MRATSVSEREDEERASAGPERLGSGCLVGQGGGDGVECWA